LKNELELLETHKKQIMKKLILSLAIIGGAFIAKTQVICAGVSPASIVGNYNFTWADAPNGWATPDFLVPGTFIQGDLMVADDDTPGLSAQGIPLGNYGCIPLINDLTGKIAVVYRYDGVTASTECEFGTKALACQNAGAIGVIIVNREPGVMTMTAGAVGASVTIPVVMISDADGATLRAALISGAVNMFIGNKFGSFPNDAGLEAGSTLISKSTGVLAQLAQNGSEFNFEIGTRVFNYGNANQTNVAVSAEVVNPSGSVVYSQTISGIDILAGDGVDLYPYSGLSFPQFNLASYPSGRYTLTYSVSLTGVDEYPYDNVFSSDFVINDSVFTYASIDAVSSLPVSTTSFRPSGGSSSYSTCIALRDPNASRIGVSGIYFQGVTSNGYDLTGEEIALTLYRWDDAFTDINDVNLAFNNLTPIASGFYYFPSDLQGETVYGAFDTPVLLEDNQRYLACAQTYNQEIYLGHDTETNYIANEFYYLQPITPVEIDGFYFTPGFGMNTPSANGLKVFTIQPPQYSAININACDSYTTSSGITYTQSGVIYDTIINNTGNGIVYLTVNLTISNSLQTSFSETICEGTVYTWNNQDYTSSGAFTQNLQTINGCDSIVTLNLTVNVNDYIQIQANPTFGNAPLTVAFNNQTANLANYNFTWYFGDGTSQQSNSPFLSHIYTQDAYSDVTVVAENTTTGCITSNFFNDMVFVIGGVSCTHTATLNQTGSLSTCVGDSILLSCNTDPTFSYQWNRNGVPVSGATSSSIYAQLSGSYTVTIYQNNCPVTSNGITVTINPLPSIPTITSTGTITSCSGGSLTLSAPAGLASYSWNTGATSSSITVTLSGNYSVTVTNASGCVRTSAPYVVNASFMQSPNVCIVGMDSLTNENRIVWEKPITTGIDSFYVYKETNVSDVYTKIGATNYPDLAVFLDQNSNPAVQAYRYKLTILDTCGTETNLGNFHKTIHLTINAGVGGAWNLIWSNYEGLTFGSYNIYRGTDPTNISLLTTIQSNLNSYTDLAPPVGPVYYQIEIVNPNSCDPAKVINYSVSKSNIVNNGVNGINALVSTSVLVYPNPTSKDVTLEITAELLGKDYFLTDNTGRIILSGQFRALKETINLEQIATGVYFIKIDNNANLMYKIVKN
jgi:hypothetical protein